MTIATEILVSPTVEEKAIKLDARIGVFEH